jgi:two-component system NtrC family sensor kinase
VQISNGVGANVTLGVSTSLLRRHDRRVTGVIATFQDLTVAKKTEEVIRRMDMLSSLGELSAGIAHEIRNPLASINFNVQILAKKLPMSAYTTRIINDTREGIDRIKTLVKGILDFARPKTPLLKPGSINRILLDSVDLMRAQLAKTHIHVETDLSEEEFRIVFDPHQIRQVFINLLLNAIDAMPNGGTLRIMTGMGMDLYNRRSYLELQIADSGIGIAAENHSKIFDPFFTTKPEGTGLGLSIVHKILEQHNSTIDIASVPNQGTTFILRFPIEV